MPSDVYFKIDTSLPVRSGGAVGGPFAMPGSGINNDRAITDTDTSAFALNDYRHINKLMNLGNSGDILVGATNTAITLTVQGSGGLRHYLGALTFGYDATPTSGRMTILDGSTVIHDEFIGSAGANRMIFPEPKAFSVGNNLAITLAAAGTGVKGSISIDERYIK